MFLLNKHSFNNIKSFCFTQYDGNTYVSFELGDLIWMVPSEYDGPSLWGKMCVLDLTGLKMASIRGISSLQEESGVVYGRVHMASGTVSDLSPVGNIAETYPLPPAPQEWEPIPNISEQIRLVAHAVEPFSSRGTDFQSQSIQEIDLGNGPVKYLCGSDGHRLASASIPASTPDISIPACFFPWSSLGRLEHSKSPRTLRLVFDNGIFAYAHYNQTKLPKFGHLLECSSFQEFDVRGERIPTNSLMQSINRCKKDSTSEKLIVYSRKGQYMLSPLESKAVFRYEIGPSSEVDFKCAFNSKYLTSAIAMADSNGPSKMAFSAEDEPIVIQSTSESTWGSDPIHFLSLVMPMSTRYNEKEIERIIGN